MELPIWLKSELSASDLGKMETAVIEAEKQTSAEIVPMIVLKSMPSFMAFFMAFLYAGFLHYASSWLLASSMPWSVGSYLNLSTTYPIYAFSLWFLFVRFPYLLRLATPKEIREYFAMRRAESEFHGLRMWETEAATGVLFFISLQEHISIILADEAIDKKMLKGSWDKILKDSLKKIKNQGFSFGVIHAVTQISNLIQKDFPISPDDIDELPNHLVIKE